MINTPGPRMPESSANTVRPQLASVILLLIASGCGVLAFLFPFLLAVMVPDATSALAPGNVAAIVFAMITLLCLAVVVAELAAVPGAPENGAKVAALLGAIVAFDACLRLIPSFGGASPIFALIILTGAVFGPRLGFLCGSLTLLLSALLTGGIGPWLPYQLLATGWVGLGAGLLPRPSLSRRRLMLIALYGVVSALGYGLVMNLYSWPFAAPDLDQGAGLFWAPGLGLSETIERYARFYVVTSLAHDLLRAAGNAVLLLAVGGPIVAMLDRARRRLAWSTPPAFATEALR